MSADPNHLSVEAASRDGRTFTYWGSAEAAFVPGDLVRLDTSDARVFLGQVLDNAVAASDRSVVDGVGMVIGALGPDGVPQRAGRAPFSKATMGPAEAMHHQALQDSTGAGLAIGTWRSSGVEVPARLRAQGFNRHTFLCGQSGSGKTYALGVLLEQLLLATKLRMVVLDPNADFVKLGEPRPDAPTEAAQRIRELDVRVLRASSAGGEPLRMRFLGMPRQAQAAVLQLDPLADRAEYSLFRHVMAQTSPLSVGDLVQDLLRGGQDERALVQRMENLGLLDWEVWAAEQASAYEVVQSGARVTVMDLGGFRDPLEPVAVSLDLVEQLWANRESRVPTLIVLDEAHNLCAATPSNPVQAAVTDRLIQIAAEGRKFGLWLLLSTQRPSKIHPQVLSQCDNLALMRMNSTGDLAELASVFGFVPRAMLQSSQFFAQGEVLLAGGFVPAPSLLQMGRRLTVEGGTDVSVPLN